MTPMFFSLLHLIRKLHDWIYPSTHPTTPPGQGREDSILLSKSLSSSFALLCLEAGAIMKLGSGSVILFVKFCAKNHCTLMGIRGDILGKES